MSNSAHDPVTNAALLLFDLKQNPSGESWTNLIGLFLEETTPQDLRDHIRQEVSRDQRLFFGAEKWRLAKPLETVGSENFVRLHGGVILITDGLPDPRDAFLLATYLVKLGSQDAASEAQLKKIKALATPRVRHLFESEILNMTLW